MRKMIRLFFYCGHFHACGALCSAAISARCRELVSRTFFGKECRYSSPVVRDAVDPWDDWSFPWARCDPLFSGLAIQLYQRVRARDYKGALFNVGFWYMLVRRPDLIPAVDGDDRGESAA
jgi:hypothetical protein